MVLCITNIGLSPFGDESIPHKMRKVNSSGEDLFYLDGGVSKYLKPVGLNFDVTRVT